MAPAQFPLGPHAIYKGAKTSYPPDVAWGSAGVSSLRSSLRSICCTTGSLQLPVMRNSRMAARERGLRKASWAMKAMAPAAGLTKAVARAALPASISGMTRAVRSCVSRAMSALPCMSTVALALLMRKLVVRATPAATLTSALAWSKAKPALNRSRKSSVRRRGSACRLSTPSSLAAPGSALRNWPSPMSSRRWPPRLG